MLPLRAIINSEPYENIDSDQWQLSMLLDF